MASDKHFSHTLDSLGRWPRPACSFAAHRQPLRCNFMYHSRIVLSVGGSVRHTVRNVLCTVTIDSVLANVKDLERFLIPCPRHVSSRLSPLTVKPASTPRRLVHTKNGEILYILICTFLLCLSWLLRSRVRDFRRQLRITLCVRACVCMCNSRYNINI
jgi:hypothetical protein